MRATNDSTPRWRNRVWSWGGQLVLLSVLVLAVEGFMGREVLGTPAPPLEAFTLNGEAVSLRQFAGRPVVVHFWASWCPVCSLEQGMIETLAAEQPVVTVAMQSGSAEAVRGYLQEKGVEYPVINDEQGRLSAAFGVKAVPASYVLDGNGQVRFVTRGYSSGIGLRARLWLAGLF